MPGDPKNPGIPDRYIKSNLKSHKIVWEPEKPIRWSYMKVLREYSTIKEFYPDINPYVEAYKMKPNTWALFSETLDGAGDPWMYLIDGPKRALVIDTGFGIGDLKALVKKLVGDKPIVVACTHHHYDHGYGNAQFETCYCHEDEVYSLRTTMNPDIWNYLMDENRKPIFTEFDPEDIIEFKEYELIPLKSNECIDLGDNYKVECIPLRGHTCGQSGWYDHQTKCIFTGDITGIGKPKKGEPKPQNLTVERLRDDVTEIVKRLKDISGVFPGHGMLDQTPIMLQYELDALNCIMNTPYRYDTKKEININDKVDTMYSKFIYQGSAIRYLGSNIYMNSNREKKD
jgi:glyoxylase-like metal-dependent hydrolase (beta-lactamase superfamily II)